jgi:hypothetical protein
MQVVFSWPRLLVLANRSGLCADNRSPILTSSLPLAHHPITSRCLFLRIKAFVFAISQVVNASSLDQLYHPRAVERNLLRLILKNHTFQSLYRRHLPVFKMIAQTPKTRLLNLCHYHHRIASALYRRRCGLRGYVCGSS